MRSWVWFAFVLASFTQSLKNFVCYHATMSSGLLRWQKKNKRRKKQKWYYKIFKSRIPQNYKRSTINVHFFHLFFFSFHFVRFNHPSQWPMANMVDVCFIWFGWFASWEQTYHMHIAHTNKANKNIKYSTNNNNIWRIILNALRCQPYTYTCQVVNHTFVIVLLMVTIIKLFPFSFFLHWFSSSSFSLITSQSLLSFVCVCVVFSFVSFIFEMLFLVPRRIYPEPERTSVMSFNRNSKKL